MSYEAVYKQCSNCGRSVSCGVYVDGAALPYCTMECYWSDLLDEDNSRGGRVDDRSLSLGSREIEGTSRRSANRLGGKARKGEKSEKIVRREAGKRREEATDGGSNAMFMYHVEAQLSSTFREAPIQRLIFL